MKRTSMLCVAAVMASIALAGAQAQQPPTAAAQTVTLIGCVEPGASANAFLLNVTEQSGAATSTATGRQPDAAISGQARVGDREIAITGEAQVNRADPPVTGTAGANFVGQRVQLIGDARANLKAHVGHQVEISGTLAPQSGRAAAETRLTVRNVRMIAATCAATTTPSTQARQPAGATASSTATTTFVGCIERGTMPNTFVLNVTESPSTPGATGQARGTVGADVVGQQIHLIGGGNLAAHAGHKVQITGMMVPQGTSPGRGGQPAAEMRLNVSNVTMMAATCTPATGTRGTTGTTPERSNEPVDEPFDAPQQQN